MPRRKKSGDAGGSLDLGGGGIDLGGMGPDLGSSTLSLGGSAMALGGGLLDLGDEEEGDGRTGDLEVDARKDMDEVLSDFQKRARAEADRFREITDTEYWCCFCFENRGQKEEFLQKLKLLDLGDKYIDGLAAAKILGVKIEQPRAEWPRIRVNKKLAELT
jgi:hypothetical protein